MSVTHGPRDACSLSLVALVVALTVTGCAVEREEAPSPPPVGDTGSPSASPDAEAPSEPAVAPAGVIPADCRDALDPAAYDAAFGDIPLNDPAFGIPASGAVEPNEPDPSAGPVGVVVAATRLWCAWADPQADITGLSARFGQVGPADVQPFFDALPADGYTCVEEYDGLVCQRTRTNEQYGVEEGSTYFVRDDIVITVEQANFPTEDLLGQFVAALWRG